MKPRTELSMEELLGRELALIQAELNRSRELTRALSGLAARIERQADRRQVLETLGAGLKELGITCLVARILTGPEPVVKLDYLALDRTTKRAVEKTMGAPLAAYQAPADDAALRAFQSRPLPIYYSQAALDSERVLPGLNRHKAWRVLDLIGLVPDARAAVFPLRRGGALSGMLGVWGAALEPVDLAPLSILASQLVMALETTDLKKQLRQAQMERGRIQEALQTAQRDLDQRKNEMHLILESTMLLSNALERSQLTAMLGEHLMLTADGDRVVFSRWEPETGKMICVQQLQRAYERQLWLPEQVVLAEMPAYLGALKANESVSLALEEDELSAGESRRLAQIGARSVLLLPLACGGKVTGLVELVSCRDHRFSEEEVKACRVIAQHAVLAVKNAVAQDRKQIETAG